jgi:hydrogenase expression/formation protein HypC
LAIDTALRGASNDLEPSMCLAIPAEILELDPTTDMAVVSLDGVRRPVSLALLDDAEVGDYVLVHVGYALNRISPEEAAETLALMREAGAL